jgi:hypothetical protein
MRGAQFRCIFLDEGLENAVDVRANRFAVGRTIVLGRRAWRCGEKKKECECKKFHLCALR